MLFSVFVLFAEGFEEQSLGKDRGEYVDGVAIRALHVFAVDVPRNRVRHVQSTLPMLDCDGVGRYQSLVWSVH